MSTAESAQMRTLATFFVLIALSGLILQACASGQAAPPSTQAPIFLPTTVANDPQCQANKPFSAYFNKTTGTLRLTAIGKKGIYEQDVSGALAYLIQAYGACITGIDLNQTADPAIIKLYFPNGASPQVVNQVSDLLTTQTHVIAEVKKP